MVVINLYTMTSSKIKGTACKLLPHPEYCLLGIEPDNKVMTTCPLVDCRKPLEVVCLLQKKKKKKKKT